jgi:hypothetical protein
MPSPLHNPNGWTLRRLINNTYAHKETRTRFDYKQRDMVRVIRVEDIKVYDGKQPGQARTKFIIRTQSPPQYAPNYTKTDSRGRPRGRQRKYRHEYQVTLQLDKLSIDVPFKLRVGASARWDFGPNGKTKKIKQGRNIKIIEGSNVVRGINADFFFRCSWLYKHEEILFGRDWTNGPPVRTNPNAILFMPKHAIAVVEYLMNRGVLQ